MSYVYHGSKISGLEKIEARVDTHKKRWVYAAPNKAAALVFINNGMGDLFYRIAGIGTKDDPIMLIERMPGTFEKIYNLPGSLYTLSGANFETGKTAWEAELVSERDEFIISEEYMVNIWQELNNLASCGEIKIYRYPNRPNDMPLDNSDLISKVIRLNDRNFTEGFLLLYPELADRYYKELEKQQINGSKVL